jgi:hypothetical protein
MRYDVWDDFSSTLRGAPFGGYAKANSEVAAVLTSRCRTFDEPLDVVLGFDVEVTANVAHFTDPRWLP